MKKVILKKSRDPGYDGIDPLIARILAQRGLGLSEAMTFLHSGKEALHDPRLLRGSQAACETIEAAIKNKELIVVFGDYDADGICATAVMYHCLTEIGAQIGLKLPDRTTNGYGISKPAILELYKKNCKLIVTVDNGVCAIDEIEYAYSLGIKVVVLDHHQPGEKLPNCEAIVNPHVADETYPFLYLAGAGVAFKIACLLYERAGYGPEHGYRLMDFAAIGTVADVVPLTNENRIIVKEGINLLRLSPRPGIEKLANLFNVSFGTLTSSDIAFKFAPAINATGRLHENGARSSLAMLLAKNENSASRYAKMLFNANQDRKVLVEQYLDKARSSYDGSKVFVYYDKDVPEGILGLIAGKLKEELSLPVIAISEGLDELKGSGRSVPGFNMVKALKSCAPIMRRYGGHPMAAGLSLEKDENLVMQLSKALNDLADNMGFEKAEIETIIAEMPLPQNKISLPLAQRLAVMEPFGEKNPKPIFLAKGFETKGYMYLSDKKHVKLFGETGNAIGFGLAQEYEALGRPEVIDLAVTLGVNGFNGKIEAQLEIVAFAQI